MGKVLVHAKIENLEDVFAADKGTLPREQIRTVEVPDALVDKGATMLSLPQRLIERLGLKFIRSRKARTTGGLAEFGVYGTVVLTVQGRDCKLDVAAVPDECPVLIGQLPLEHLDFVVDPMAQ